MNEYLKITAVEKKEELDDLAGAINDLISQHVEETFELGQLVGAIQLADVYGIEIPYVETSVESFNIPFERIKGLL
jgi:hypothetical protein